MSKKPYRKANNTVTQTPPKKLVAGVSLLIGAGLLSLVYFNFIAPKFRDSALQREIARPVPALTQTGDASIASGSASSAPSSASSQSSTSRKPQVPASTSTGSVSPSTYPRTGGVFDGKPLPTGDTELEKLLNKFGAAGYNFRNALPEQVVSMPEGTGHCSIRITSGTYLQGDCEDTSGQPLPSSRANSSKLGPQRSAGDKIVIARGTSYQALACSYDEPEACSKSDRELLAQAVNNYDPKYVARSAFPIFNCRVTKVHDGDTIHCLRDGEAQTYKIRFFGIDAPELSQTNGREVTKYVAPLLKDATIQVIAHDVDKYGRLLGTLFVKGTNLNYELVKGGYTFAYPQVSKGQLPYNYYFSQLRNAAALARIERKVIWVNGKVQTAKEYRDSKK